MALLTGASANPVPLIWLQIALAVGAVGTLVFVLYQHDRALATIVGVLLAHDLNWGSANRWVLTDGQATSFLVLSLVLLLNHYDRRERVPAWELVAGGILYSWTATLRPSNTLLLVPVVITYLWFLRVCACALVIFYTIPLVVSRTSSSNATTWCSVRFTRCSRRWRMCSCSAGAVTVFSGERAGCPP